MLIVIWGAVETSGSAIFLADGSVESSVAANDGFFVSVMGSNKVVKTDFEGNLLQGFTGMKELSEPRGLAIFDQSLFVAHNGGVDEFLISATGATKTRSFDVAATTARPNGLCLSPDGSTLFVTDPGWKLMPWQAAGKSGLAAIDVSSGTVRQIFSDVENLSPNGCTVDQDGVVWMINMRDGISLYDPKEPATSIATLLWSEDVRNEQRGSQMAGDGIVLLPGWLCPAKTYT